MTDAPRTRSPRLPDVRRRSLVGWLVARSGTRVLAVGASAPVVRALRESGVEVLAAPSGRAADACGPEGGPADVPTCIWETRACAGAVREALERAGARLAPAGSLLLVLSGPPKDVSLAALFSGDAAGFRLRELGMRGGRLLVHLHRSSREGRDERSREEGSVERHLLASLGLSQAEEAGLAAELRASREAEARLRRELASAQTLLADLRREYAAFRRARSIRLADSVARRLPPFLRRREAPEEAEDGRPPSLARRLPPPDRWLPAPNRVLHLLHWSLPHRQVGYTLRSHFVLRAQRRLGWDACGLTPPDFPRGTSGRVEKLDEVEYHRLGGVPLPERPSLDERLEAYVRCAAPVVEATRPGLLHAASDHRNAFVAESLARHFGLPWVYEVRGLWEESRVASGTLSRESREFSRVRAAEGYCMRRADAVVTISEALRGEVIERGVDPSRVFVVPNAVDPDVVRPVRRDAALAASLGVEDAFVLGYLGSVRPFEGLDTVVKAVALLRGAGMDVAFLVVGSGAEVAAQRSLAEALGVSDAVRFVEAVPHERLPAYYSVIDAVVCARRREPVCELVTPLKPYEAMAYGKPVLLSDLPALREMVRDGETGLLFEAESAVALAESVTRLVLYPDLRARIAEAGARFVARERTWERCCGAYEEAYAAARASRAAALE